MSNNKISVVINTYNASQHLARVLETVKDFDEIVICDMESTDDTCKIAESYGCKIVVFPKGDCKICEPARQTAIDAASYKWVFVVDADELVPMQLKDYLYGLIAHEDVAQGYYVPRKVSLWGGLCIVSILITNFAFYKRRYCLACYHSCRSDYSRPNR